MSADQPSHKNRTFLLAIAAIIVTVAAVWLIYSTEPNAPREGASKKTAMLVDVMEVAPDTHRPVIEALGNVRAAKRIMLMPEVEGTVIAVSEAFVPGNVVSKGEPLLKIDDREYQFALKQAKGNLAKAQAAYDIEMGEQIRAKKEFNTLGKNASGANKALMLREPQKNRAEADLLIAQANLEQAQFDLQRTQVDMPFDGQILSQDVNLGARVTESTQVATLIGLDRYWVHAAIPSKQLKWIVGAPNTTKVNIIDENAWPAGVSREGTLKQVVAELDQQTRMANVIIEVTDPMQLKGRQVKDGDDERQLEQQQAPLISGAYVSVEIPGKALANSFKIPLKYLRKNNTLWVKQDSQLDIREATVAFKDYQFAYITQGLKPGDQLVKTDLARVRQGAELRLKAEGK